MPWVINNSSYPQTKSLNGMQSIMSFPALKLSDIRRYGPDDIWCMDRGGKVLKICCFAQKSSPGFCIVL